MQGHNCPLFDESELVLGIAVEGSASFGKKKIAEMTKVAQGYGVAGMAWIKNIDGLQVRSGFLDS